MRQVPTLPYTITVYATHALKKNPGACMNTRYVQPFVSVAFMLALIGACIGGTSNSQELSRVGKPANKPQESSEPISIVAKAKGVNVGPVPTGRLWISVFGFQIVGTIPHEPTEYRSTNQENHRDICSPQKFTKHTRTRACKSVGYAPTVASAERVQA